MKFDNLWKAMEHSYKALEPFRSLVYGLVAEFAGTGYGKGNARPKFETLVNLMNQTVETYTMNLVANRPRVMASAKRRDLTYFARYFETAVNNLIAEIHLEDTLRRSVLDAFFCVGIVKVHRSDSVEVQLESDLWADPGTPFASNVSIDNWVHDMAATKYSKVQFAGDWYRVPFDDLQNGMFDQAAIRSMALQPTTKLGYGETDERLDRIAAGTEVDQDEVQPMIDLCDVWVPRDRLIYTFPIDPKRPFASDRKPIAALPPDDPDAGPYDLLAFHDVPENVMPSSPASHLSGMARIINNIMRKQARKAHSQKDILTYTPAGAKDAEQIIKTSDQQTVAVQEQSEIGVMKMGGVDQALHAYMVAMLELYNRMAGNLTAMAGLGSQAPTLGQEEMVQGTVSKKEAAMQYRVVDHATRIIRRLGRMLWEDKAKVIPGTMTVQGLEDYRPLDVPWLPGNRQGDFSEYDLDIDVYSLPYQAPTQKFQTMLNLLQNVFLPAAPMLMQQGGTIRLQKVAESAARLLNAPELRDWIDFGGGALPPPQPGQEGEEGAGTPEMAGMPPSTTRNYVRRSVPTGGSPENRSTMDQQAWLGAAGQDGGTVQGPQMMGATR